LTPAIETSYKGFRFRSRVEARWAVYLDTLGVDWLYEKEGFELPSGRYLPDFWIPCPSYHDEHSGYWLEIKGADPTETELAKCMELAQITGHITLLVYGSPTFEIFHTYSFDPMRKDGKVVGVKKSNTKETDPNIQKLFDLLKYDPRKEPFYSHFDLATRFLHGQGKEYDPKSLEEAIINARSARFEFGESGV
jgi:hypothetical protein